VAICTTAPAALALGWYIALLASLAYMPTGHAEVVRQVHEIVVAGAWFDDNIVATVLP
jgi:hypothetical protein